MKITILTLFPNMFSGFISESIIKRAIERKLVTIEIVNIRDFSEYNNQQVDDTPYGGGAGMVLMMDPLVKALKSVKTEDSITVLLTPTGVTWKQSLAQEYAKKSHIILICGHYEGVDERILNYVDAEISIGDFILTGGEIPAMAIADSLIRLIDGVIKKESSEEETFSHDLFDYPTYTKPAVYDGYAVPDVLLSGNHEKIRLWREEMARKKTEERRPDLLNKEG